MMCIQLNESLDFSWVRPKKRGLLGGGEYYNFLEAYNFIFKFDEIGLRENYIYFLLFGEVTPSVAMQESPWAFWLRHILSL